jgi:hypothetical protein
MVFPTRSREPKAYYASLMLMCCAVLDANLPLSRRRGGFWRFLRDRFARRIYYAAVPPGRVARRFLGGRSYDAERNPLARSSRRFRVRRGPRQAGK